MTAFNFRKTSLESAVLIEYFFAGDNRGIILKSYEKEIFKEAGIEFEVNETFVSKSAQNVLRGLHFQTHNPQAKLVNVLNGRVYDVIVDLRKESPTYLKWEGFDLSADNHLALYVPKGFAHGFVALAPDSIMQYQCYGAYDKQTDTGIRFDDPEIGVIWPDNVMNYIISEKDLALKYIAESDICFWND